MYFVKLRHSEYEVGITVKFGTAAAAARYVSETLPWAVPDADGRPVKAEIWGESDIPEAPEIENDDGSGVGQTFSP